jgi:hypothetical protein
LTISVSLVLLLGLVVWLLYRYDGLKPWHGFICLLFGFLLASTSFAPEIRTAVTAIINALTGQG